MSKWPILVAGLMAFWAIEPGLAQDLTDETGVIESTLYWDHIIGAYVVTWLALLGYTASLWVRRPKGECP
jgi:hypothetical protein